MSDVANEGDSSNSSGLSAQKRARLDPNLVEDLAVEETNQMAMDPADAGQSQILADPETSAMKLDKFHLFTSLPNELIVNLMSNYFSCRENVILSRMNSRLHSLALGCPLSWKNIDIDNTIDDFDTIDYVMKYLASAEQTAMIQITSHINGSNASSKPLPLSIIHNLRMVTPNLTKLKLIGQKFEGKIIDLLPQTLKELDLSNSFARVVKYLNIPNEEQPMDIRRSYSSFEGINRFLPLLEVLVLDSCLWILPFDLIHLGRLEQLKKLSLRGCRLSDHSPRAFGTGVHYREPNAIRRVQWRRIFSELRLGFLTLEDLDITDSDISRSGIIHSLLAVGTGSRFTHNTYEGNGVYIVEREEGVFSPLKTLKMGYYDSDYVWGLMGCSINLSHLETAKNLQFLDVSGFELEVEAGTRLKSLKEFDEAVIKAYDLKELKQVWMHYCNGLSDFMNNPSRKRKASDSEELSTHDKVKTIKIDEISYSHYSQVLGPIGKD